MVAFMILKRNFYSVHSKVFMLSTCYVSDNDVISGGGLLVILCHDVIVTNIKSRHNIKSLLFICNA